MFRFAKYRDYYVQRLFQGVRQYGMDMLDYIVTSNHVHLLVAAKGERKSLRRCDMFTVGSDSGITVSVVRLELSGETDIIRREYRAANI